MTRSILKPCLVCLCLLLAGCLTPSPADGPLTMQKFIAERTVYFDNGKVRLGVSPALGRIVWFGSPATGNLLWLNDAQGLLTDQATHGWANWGGDKVWPAPQSDWPRVMGHRWPPDPVIDGQPWRVIDQHDLGCTIESQPSPYWGVTVRRQISLDPHRPRVEIRNTITRVAACDWPVNVWSVTQVRHPLYGLADAAAGETASPAWRWLSPVVDRTPPVVRVLNGAIRYTPPTEPATKIGTMGRWIAAVYANAILLQHASEPDPSLTYADDASVHAYADARCMELELLSPVRSLEQGEHLLHVVTWQIIERSPASQSVERDLQVIMARLAEEP